MCVGIACSSWVCSPASRELCALCRAKGCVLLALAAAAVCFVNSNAFHLCISLPRLLYIHLTVCWRELAQSKSGIRRGRLKCQDVSAKGKLFRLFYLLYVDNGAFLFRSRKDLIAGTRLIYHHFRRFGLLMHIGRGNQKSKSECMHFPRTPR